MAERSETTVRRLGAGDEAVVATLATRTPQTALLEDPRCLFLVAFDGGEPVGFVLAYELLRRHGDPSLLCIYEVDVRPERQRRGIASRLLRELERLALERGIREGFVLAEPGNEPANRLYEAIGATREDAVMWVVRYPRT